jgi:DNA-binding NarL/FixJ family response regulator
MVVAAVAAVITRKPTCGWEQDASLAPRASASARGLAAPTVWLIDDDDELRNLLGELLNSQGLACNNEFDSPEAALRALTTETAPDVVLLDVNMGDANGLEAIEPIKARAPSTHVLMLTTFYDSLSEAKAFEAGASGFLLKSYEPEQIVQAIRQIYTRSAHTPPTRSALWLNRSSERRVLNPPTLRREESRSGRLGFFRGLLNLLTL